MGLFWSELWHGIICKARIFEPRPTPNRSNNDIETENWSRNSRSTIKQFEIIFRYNLIKYVINYLTNFLHSFSLQELKLIGGLQLIPTFIFLIEPHLGPFPVSIGIAFDWLYVPLDIWTAPSHLPYYSTGNTTVIGIYRRDTKLPNIEHPWQSKDE